MFNGLMSVSVGLVLLVTVAPVQAEYVVYSNRTTFEAALKNEATEIFNELGPNIRDYGTTGLGQAQGLFQNLKITGSSSYLYSASSSVFAGYYPANSTYLVGPISSTNTDGITVVLPTNTYSAAGADVTTFATAGKVSFFGTTSLGEQFSGSVAVDGSSLNAGFGFLGVTTTTPNDFVTSLTFSAPVGSFQNIVIDNVSFGAGTPAVPEPTSMALIVTGALCAGVRRYRGRRAVRMS